MDERADQLDPLLVAEREILEVVPDPVSESEVGEPPRRLCPGVVAGQATESPEVLELVEHFHRRVEPTLLGEVAEAAAGLVVDAPTVPANLAGVEGDETEDRPHRGGLAGAVGPEKTGHRAWLDGEGHAVEGTNLAVRADETIHFEHLIEITPHVVNSRRRAGER